jgi:hypothetical protein
MSTFVQGQSDDELPGEEPARSNWQAARSEREKQGGVSHLDDALAVAHSQCPADVLVLKEIEMIGK